MEPGEEELPEGGEVEFHLLPTTAEGIPQLPNQPSRLQFNEEGRECVSQAPR